jgi:hypothetical protein
MLLQIPKMFATFCASLFVLMGASCVIAYTIKGSDRRLISIGDLHGDYECLIKILQRTGLISVQDSRWTGGNTTLIQLGDILDRGNESAKILRLLAKLQIEAKEASGEIVILMGNHEWMNLRGDYRYAGEKEDFSPQTRCEALEETGGEFGVFIRSFPVVVKVDYGQGRGILFVHGGLESKFLNKTVDHDPLEELNERFRQQTDESLVGMDGPLWNRFLARGTNVEAVCSDLGETLRTTGTDQMVVGHTTQSYVSYRCDGKLILSDVETCVGLEYNETGVNIIH